MAETILKPYIHDCDQCIWVGWIPCRDAKNGYGNMYVCQKCLIPSSLCSVIIRYGDGGDEYLSMPVGVITKGSLGVKHNTPMTAQQTYDLAVEAIDHVAQANWEGRDTAAKRWLAKALVGNDEKSLDEIQEEISGW